MRTKGARCMVSAMTIETKIPALGTPRRFQAGSSLFRAGEKAAAFFRIEAGAVRVLRTNENGRELEVARLGPGDFLGEAFALTGKAFPFSAVAAETTTASRFEAARIRNAIAADPDTALFFIGLLAEKCVLLSGRVESFGLKTVRQRLAQYLLQSCEGAPSGLCTVGLAVKKSELAVHLGTVGETLSRALSAMAYDGLIEVKGRAIRILDCRSLRAEIGG
ncbi:MAG: Crp/Fnr family transcriptional regulator [Candidatus Aminicenantes bacterium]|nr:Crp/Fnr family transcriptional regulator [Candidatus Aminicenantes bacterium]